MAASVLESTAEEAKVQQPICRFCWLPLRDTFIDLGMSPLCESFLQPDQLNQMEPFYPLRVFVCRGCLLVQLQEYVTPESIFSEYAYFSSFSESWLRHAREYSQAIVKRLHLNDRSWVVEVGSNDGYLLQNFVADGIPVLGLEPARNVAVEALRRGVPTLTLFFGEHAARQLTAGGRRADLLIGNNVLAQAPNINDFVEGLKIMLGPRGVVTLEFPHLLRLIEGNQFDTIYHEHFSYFSLYTLERILTAHGLTVFDVEELPTHGGSLRVYAGHSGDPSKIALPAVQQVRDAEVMAGLDRINGYGAFGPRVVETKHRLLEHLIELKRQGKSIAGYGAPGKGNTLLNYCGIGTDLLDYTVDRNPYKHGLFLPGSRIPIFPTERIAQTKPDYIVILPWNIKDEIVRQLAYAKSWGARFLAPIPTVQEVEA